MITRLAIITASVALAGCASVANISYDANEYEGWLRLGWIATSLKPTCVTAGASASAELIRSMADYSYTYSLVKGESNARVAQAGRVVQGLTVELVGRYAVGGNPSSAYCEIKLADISAGAMKIASSIAKKE